MTFITYALLLLWLPVTLMALFFVLRPSKRWPLFGTRWRSFLLAIAFAFGIPVLAALIAPEGMKVREGEPAAGSVAASSATKESEKDAPKAETASSGATGADDLGGHAEHYLELGGVKLSKGKSGAVLLSGTITSAAEVAIKNPHLKCYLSKGNADVGAVSDILHKTIPAGGELAFSALDMGAADGAWDHQVCEITEAEVVKRGT